VGSLRVKQQVRTPQTGAASSAVLLHAIAPLVRLLRNILDMSLVAS
jgi:hypothetical protein